MSDLLAFLDIFVESSEMDDVIEALLKIDSVEELYEVTGEFDVVTLLRCGGIEEFREILKNRILKIKGVKSTVSSVVLHSHKGPRSNGEEHKPSQSRRQ